MALTTVSDLVEALRKYQLLRPAQLTVLAKQAVDEFTDPKVAVDSLVQRKWLTGFQRDLVAGKGPENLVVGPYILLEPIGAGGMGEVFKARHRVIDRVVALKVIRQEQLAADEKAVARFQREARAAAQLFHPNVVLLYDADRVDDTYYIAMQYIDGMDLSQMVKKNGPLPVMQACEFVRQAAVGLQHAHQHGIIHRDIKPSNLLVSGLEPSPKVPKADPTLADASFQAPKRQAEAHAEGPTEPIVKILDLGVIRFAEEYREQTKDASLTQEGAMVGTPDYMAPEQARDSRSVDGRTDIYGLGCTLYYLLTGQVPFPEGTAMEKLLQHQLDEPEQIEKLRPEVPAAIASVVRKMMAKLVKERYASAAEVVKVLEALLAPPPAPIEITRQNASLPSRAAYPPAARPEPPRQVPAPSRTEPPRQAPAAAKDDRSRHSPPTPPEAPQRQTLPGTRPEQPRPSAPAARAEQPRQPGPSNAKIELPRPADDPPATPRPLVSTFVNLPPLAPEDVENAKAQQGRPLASSLYHWQVGSEVPDDGQFPVEPIKPIAIQKGHQGCTMSLAFALHRDTLASGGVDGSVRLWDFSGKRPRALAVMKIHQQAVHSLEFAPDNVTLASGSGASDGQIWVWSVTRDSVKETALLEGHDCAIDAMAFSTNGQVLASGGNDATVRIWDLAVPEPGQRRVLKGHRNSVKALAFSSDGQHLASGAMDHTVRLWGLDRWWSKERAVLSEPSGHIYAVAFNAQGKLLAGAGQDQNIYLWDISTSPPRLRHVLKGHQTSVRQIVFTPDGQFLVSVGDGGRVIQWDILSQAQVRAWQLSTVLISTYAMTFDGRYIAAGTSDGPVIVFRLGHKRRSGMSSDSGNIEHPFFE